MLQNCGRRVESSTTSAPKAFSRVTMSSPVPPPKPQKPPPKPAKTTAVTPPPPPPPPLDEDEEPPPPSDDDELPPPSDDEQDAPPQTVPKRPLQRIEVASVAKPPPPPPPPPPPSPNPHPVPSVSKTVPTTSPREVSTKLQTPPTASPVRVSLAVSPALRPPPPVVPRQVQSTEISPVRSTERAPGREMNSTRSSSSSISPMRGSSRPDSILSTMSSLTVQGPDEDIIRASGLQGVYESAILQNVLSKMNRDGKFEKNIFVLTPDELLYFKMPAIKPNSLAASAVATIASVQGEAAANAIPPPPEPSRAIPLITLTATYVPHLSSCVRCALCA
jgi:hypothetical protein